MKIRKAFGKLFIQWNMNIPEQVKKAEKAKQKAENCGATLKDTIINNISGDCTLVYINN